jgi:hypothetical protein
MAKPNLKVISSSIRISVTSKLDGIRSWSLQAIDTCPGSLGSDGQLVAACSGCYATTGNYRFSNVKAPREHNKEDWKREGWEDDMVAALENDDHFRWLDSGDLYAVALARKVYNVMKRTPWVSHWLPTRMMKFKKFQTILASMQALPNVMVRFSSDSVLGVFDSRHGSVIVPDAASVPTGTKLCEAYQHGGKCNGCRACYDKSVAVIAYPAHGRKMDKIIRIALAA